IDASPYAIGRATARGAAVLERSLFDELPGEGRWPCVLLFDGNIGIGGDPVALLTRARQLLSPDGVMIVEVEPPGGTTATLTHVRLELDGERSEWFPWAWVAADDLDAIAAEAGVRRRRWRRIAGRWFAELEAVPG
ncbi:MAG TPA: hypothetical protein VMT43_07310, partial [Acidimicrobiales bacterium]|nr:hypothetical protein [Acidimicrobiales bacterium]